MSDTSQCYHPCLAVYVLWHPSFERGEELASQLYADLCNNPQRPAERSIGIPVRFRSGPGAPGERLPREVALDEASHSAVIVLVDDEMVADEDWGPYVARVCEQVQQSDGRHRVYPVSLSEYAFQLDPTVAAANFIRLHENSPENQPQLLLNRVTHEICRLLLNRPRAGDEQGNLAAGPAPITVFISHAKAGGVELAEEVRNYIHGNLQLKTFFDAQDIPYGAAWVEVLRESVGRSALLVLESDAYASREWCRNEVLWARHFRAPMVVVNAISDREPRRFPYLGNVPTLRWPTATALPYETMLGMLLYEVLRFAYFPRRLEELSRLYAVPLKNPAIPFPPDLLAALQLKVESAASGSPLFVYPDPPLSTEEMRLVRQFAPELCFTTPTMLPLLNKDSTES